MTKPKFHVILRSCDVVHSLHNAPRPFGLDKKTLIKVCFISMYRALQGTDHTITVLGDKLSDETTKFFEGYGVKVIKGSWGNDESIRQGITLALDVPDDEWVYLCEDDYLHSPQAFSWMEDLIVNRNSYIKSKRLIPQLKFKRDLTKVPLVIHPPDYPDRYLEKYLRSSLIFLGKECHWRQISHTTFTLLAQGKTFRRYKTIFLNSCRNADDGYLSNNLFASWSFMNKALCVSPIPGVATHMHEEVMTPLVNWEQIANEILAELRS